MPNTKQPEQNKCCNCKDAIKNNCIGLTTNGKCIRNKQNNDWREEFFFKFTRWITSGSVEYRSIKTDSPTYIGEILDWFEGKLKEQLEREHQLCKNIYIDNVDWSEWNLSDDKAGKKFEEYYLEQRQKLEEIKGGIK